MFMKLMNSTARKQSVLNSQRSVQLSCAAAVAVAAAVQAMAAPCLTEFRVSTATNIGPAGITTGPDGNLWFTERQRFTSTGNSIGRITTSGGITLFPILTTNGLPLGI